MKILDSNDVIYDGGLYITYIKNKIKIISNVSYIDWKRKTVQKKQYKQVK